MSDHPSARHLDRRDLIRSGILAGVGAVLPWQGARAELPQVARNRTIILVWGGREGRWAGTSKTECGLHVEVVEP